MKCPHCGHIISSPKLSSPGWVLYLRYMIDKGWLFQGTLADDKWKTDPGFVTFVERGWVEMDRAKGFRITSKGIDACAAFKEGGQG